MIPTFQGVPVAGSVRGLRSGLLRLCSQVLLATLCVSLAAPRAWAAPRGKTQSVAVVAIGDQKSASSVARLQYLGEQAVRGSGRFQLRELAELLDEQGLRLRREKAEEGRVEFETAKKLYDELEVQKAAEHFDRSLAAYERCDLSTNFPLLVRSWMLRIASLLANADQRAATVELNLLLPLDLKTAFDPSLFTPDFLAQVKAKREEIRAKSNLPLVLDTTPASAQVYVNGTFRGVTPLEVKGLPPADHYVTLIAPGYEFLQKRMRPGGGKSVEELKPTSRRAALEGLLEQLRENSRGEGRVAPARDLARALGVEQVIVLASAQRGETSLVNGFRVTAAGEELGRSNRRLVLDLEAASVEVEGFFSDVLGSDSASPVVAEDGESGWTARHTGYVLAGTAVAALVSGIIFGQEAMSQVKAYRDSTHAQPNGAYAQWEKAGRDYALVADLSFLGALLAGAGAGYLVFLHEPAPQGEVLLPPPPKPAPAVEPTPAPGPDWSETVEPARGKRSDDKRPGRKNDRRRDDYDDLRDD